jgi:hypothetical protein
MGLEQDCATCHEDSHEGRYVLACARCHGQESFEQLEAFGHEKHLPLIGGHAEVSCADCHGDESPHSLDALGVGGRPGDRTCLECHASPHTEEFVRTSSRIADMAPGAACVVCHEHEHPTFREAVLTELVTAEQHQGSGFSLAFPHDEAACADCHSVDVDEFVGRYPGRGADQCSACHEDPHGGQFAVGPFSSGDCITCHDRTAFDPHAFTVEQHELTTLPLFGAHVETDCNACHLIPDDHGASDQIPPRAFRGSPGNCEERLTKSARTPCRERGSRLIAITARLPANRQATDTTGKTHLEQRLPAFSLQPANLLQRAS